MDSKQVRRERRIFACARLAELRHRYSKALTFVEELEGLRPLELREQAFKAWLLLRTGEPERSHHLFLKVREEAKSHEDAEHAYILHYAQARLAHIRFDPFNAREQERKAAKIICNPRLKRLLWLPAPDQPDRLEEEFDAWMKKNAPKKGDLRKRRI